MKKFMVMIQKSINWVREHSIFQKLVWLVIFLGASQVFGQHVSVPTHYDAEHTAKHIMMGHIKMYLNDSTTEVVVEKKNNRWVTTFLGNDNEIDVLNTQHAVLNRAYEIIKHGSLAYDLFMVEGTANLEPFTERFENYMAGWTMTFDIVTPNEMTIC